MPAALLVAPIFGYGFAWVGHFAFEKNKPASWASLRAAAWSLRGDLRMWRKMLAGKMDAIVEQYRDYGATETTHAPVTNGASGATHAHVGAA